MFCYGKVATLGWDPDKWRWVDGGRFLNYTTNDGRHYSINRNPVTLGRHTNDKVTSHIIISTLGLKCGTLLDLAKMSLSCGIFDTRRWRSMSGEPKLPQPLFPNTMFF